MHVCRDLAKEAAFKYLRANVFCGPVQALQDAKHQVYSTVSLLQYDTLKGFTWCSKGFQIVDALADPNLHGWVQAPAVGIELPHSMCPC